MSSKNITITEDAYKYLKRLKGEQKSFSEVILSFKERKNDVMSYAGALKDADLESVENIRDQMREDWEER